jgi:thiamine biosynthesis lipoprotein ApbE
MIAAMTSMHCLILLHIPLLIFSGCAKQPVTTATFDAGGMTGAVLVARSNHQNAGPAADLLAKSIAATIAALDATNPVSDVAKLNRVGNSLRLPLSRPTFRALDLGKHYSMLTDGAYDFTTRPLADLWRKGKPSPEEVERVKNATGIKYMEVSDGGSIAFTIPGLSITPGLLAPAYALDVAVVGLRGKIKGPVLVQFDPFARREGVFPVGEIPEVAIKLPDDRETLAGHLDLSRFPAMASLAPNRRLVIDPRTGHPAQGKRLVVVIGPLVTKAYVLAEALVVLGRTEGAKIMPNFPGHEVLIVTESNPPEYWMTPGFKSAFTPVAENILIKDWLIASPEPAAGGVVPAP